MTVSFTTDSERHRIQTLHKNAEQGRNHDAHSAGGHDPSNEEGKVAGILINKKDNWITVKADGEDEPVKYVVDATDGKLLEAFKAVFNACRVQLTYKKDGDARQLVGIKRQILKPNWHRDGRRREGLQRLLGRGETQARPGRRLCSGRQLQRQGVHGEAEGAQAG